MQHHEDTLAAYVEQVRQDPGVVAVVLGGSVARGTERPDSDVDVSLVVTEDAFARSWEQERLSYVDRAAATYEGGYVDVKVVTTDYLRKAAVDGDDPVRASFLGNRTAWTRDDEVPALVAAVPLLSGAAFREREGSFIAQVRLYVGYFLRQGLAHDDVYLTRWAAVHGVGAAGRALLARARVLHPGAKYLSGLVAALPDLPSGYPALADDLLREPTEERRTAFLEMVEGVGHWPVAPEESLSRFVRENELAWLTRVPPPEYG